MRVELDDVGGFYWADETDRGARQLVDFCLRDNCIINNENTSPVTYIFSIFDPTSRFLG